MKISCKLAILLLVLSAINSQKVKKVSMPKKNVEVEVFRDPVKTELDLTPITDFYAIQGNDLGVSYQYIVI